MSVSRLYQKQISLTEWFESIQHKDAKLLRKEDNEKRERLKLLNEVANIPFDRPYQFAADEIDENNPSFKDFLKEHGEELCALRLIPKEEDLPKLRTRGDTIEHSLHWFKEQSIDPEKYRAEFVPHVERNDYATIFIVNAQGIFGEIIEGGHHQLTQGFHDAGIPMSFSLVFDDQGNVDTSKLEPPFKEEIEKVISLLKITDKNIQETLSKQLNAKFHHNYLAGYFETVCSKEFGLWFIDYNRLLGDVYGDFIVQYQNISQTDTELAGKIGNKGKVIGKIKLIDADSLDSISIRADEVLLCVMTTPEYISLMKESCGIITEQGGILSHAAIVARELNKPCIVGVKDATKILKDGDIVELNGDSGVVRIVESV